MNTKAKKIISITLNVIVWAFLLFALLVTILTFASKNTSDGVPSVFGKSFVTVQSDSMKSDKPESFKTGDMLIIKKILPEQAKQLTEGTIIVYRAPIDIDGDGYTGDVNTHRIVSVRPDGDITYYTTQGDNREMCPNPDGYELRYTDIIGVYEGGKLAGLGGVADFLRSSLGFGLVVVLPMALFFLYELYALLKIVMDLKIKKASAGAVAIDEEEIKRRAIEEYLAKQNAEKNADSDDLTKENTEK